MKNQDEDLKNTSARLARTSRQSRISRLSKQSVYSSNDVFKWKKSTKNLGNTSSYLLSPAALSRRLKFLGGTNSVVKEAVLEIGAKDTKEYQKLFG